MPPKRKGRNGQRSSRPGSGGDRLGALPDHVLHHVLSFLPAQDAVQTCVLARRWRHLWKSAPSLRIIERPREFVDHLLRLHGGSPLDTCELCSGHYDNIPRWTRQILERKVRVLILHLSSPFVLCSRLCSRFVLKLGPTLISNHLRKLHLSHVKFGKLDVSRCPALEVLEIDDCIFLYDDTISSQSLKCLSINSECIFCGDYRFRIHAPNLHSLRLEIGYARTPVLERMPSLVEACVILSDYNFDCCDKSARSGDCEDEGCKGCYGVRDATNNCVLLKSLSEAQNLALTADINIFIFRRDLKWCPIFGNLKSLLLNEYWCVPSDFSALAYMLEHSPILGKLTLQLYCKGPKSKVEMKGIPEPTERSAAMSEHLKIVDVKCEAVDDKVLEVLKFLSKLGIRFRF